MARLGLTLWVVGLCCVGAAVGSVVIEHQWGSAQELQCKRCKIPIVNKKDTAEHERIPPTTKEFLKGAKKGQKPTQERVEEMFGRPLREGERPEHILLVGTCEFDDEHPRPYEGYFCCKCAYFEGNNHDYRCDQCMDRALKYDSYCTQVRGYLSAEMKRWKKGKKYVDVGHEHDDCEPENVERFGKEKSERRRKDLNHLYDVLQQMEKEERVWTLKHAPTGVREIEKAKSDVYNAATRKAKKDKKTTRRPRSAEKHTTSMATAHKKPKQAKENIMRFLGLGAEFGKPMGVPTEIKYYGADLVKFPARRSTKAQDDDADSGEEDGAESGKDDDAGSGEDDGAGSGTQPGASPIEDFDPQWANALVAELNNMRENLEKKLEQLPDLTLPEFALPEDEDAGGEDGEERNMREVQERNARARAKAERDYKEAYANYIRNELKKQKLNTQIAKLQQAIHTELGEAIVWFLRQREENMFNFTLGMVARTYAMIRHEQVFQLLIAAHAWLRFSNGVSLEPVERFLRSDE